MSRPLVTIALFCFFFCSCSHAFYLPGVAPKDYLEGEEVELKVNSLTSIKTQLPYDYYSLNFCQEPQGPRMSAENLGEILLGDKIESSPYNILMLTDISCAVLCTNSSTKEQLQEFDKRIRQEYRVNWLLDNLPAATKKTILDVSGGQSYVYEAGFPLGRVDFEKGVETAFLNNHIEMTIYYSKTKDDVPAYRVVGFEVQPKSIHHGSYDKHDPSDVPETCFKPTESQGIDPNAESQTITFTYEVSWVENSELLWTSRWDVYLKMTDTQIHWFSILNSLMILFFLTGMVALIMRRILNADFRRYEMDQEEAQEETGWKLVHGDVFRPPNNRILLSILYGSGVQVFLMAVITLVFALLGFLSPANRGGLMIAMIVLFVLMALFAGYFSSRIYKSMKGTNWIINAVSTAFAFPGTSFLIFFVLNVLLGLEKSTGYVHFGILFGISLLWFGISVPLALFGSYLGFKKPVVDPPVRTNQIPRQIPEQVWYMRPAVAALMGGVLPFGAIFIQLFYILNSVWLHQFYYMFGFLFLVFVILIITCSEITIVMCYFQLCSEDYHWWWRSYLTSGASAFYVFIYAIFYFFNRLQITSVASAFLYFGYTSIMAMGFFVLTGSIGFYSCYLFVRKIYGSIKVA